MYIFVQDLKKKVKKLKIFIEQQQLKDLNAIIFATFKSIRHFIFLYVFSDRNKKELIIIIINSEEFV